ncbi:MAG TPA: PH domain-containing protein [Solirubrobacterales bacterium]|nr:PH domain-containing protein [Solirubrobacterales bacterium]
MVDTEPDKEILPKGEILRLNDWSRTAAFALATLVGVLGMMLIATKGSPSQNFDGSLRPAVGLVWLGFALMIAGEARSGLIVEEQGVLVQGWLRRRRICWTEIEGFVVKQPFFRQALRIRLVKGGTVTVPGFSPRSANERNLVEERVHELNCRASNARAT